MIPRSVPGQIATIVFLGTTLLFGLRLISQTHGGTKPGIPKTWDNAAIEALELPLANPVGSPKHISADYYYNIPVRPIYKQYPVYAPGREPDGYTDWLKKQKPVIVWDDAGHKPPLETEADWIKAGELVFDAYVFANPGEGGLIGLNDVRSNAWYQSNQIPVTPMGVLPFLTLVIREKGKIELGSFSCGMCHTRVLPSGAVLKGAQGNFPLIERWRTPLYMECRRKRLGRSIGLYLPRRGCNPTPWTGN